MKKIAIIGCGISGLYFANQLQNNKLYDYTIYEKKNELNLNDGYGIQLSVNSIKLLNEIGFKNILANEIFFPKMVNFFDAKSCKKICEINISKFNNENNLSDYINKIKKNSKNISDKSLNEIELNKCKLELTKKYYLLGKYISKKYYDEKILDFSYDEEYKKMCKDIYSLKNYIKNLST